MPEAAGIPDFNSPVVEHARKDFPLLDADMTVAEALDRIRREGIGERVIYFFAVDADKRLVGVLPTRRLLTSPLDTSLREIMVRRVIAIPASASVLDACEFFVLYKFFAFPVIDEHRHVVGVIDASLFADEILQAGESEDRHRPAAPVRDDVFEILGFHLEQIRGASPWRVFVAFFLTMVLGLNESVSAQSMSVTIQMLRSAPVTWGWFAAALRREFTTALLLGLSCGSIVTAIVWFWKNDLRSAGAIGGSIALSLVTACLFGLAVPSFLHRLKLDPKIAAGPITLAFADIFALLLYFTTARLVLR